MLRSSREGRKQAARYHTSSAVPSGSSLPDSTGRLASTELNKHLIKTIPVSLFSRRNTLAAPFTSYSERASPTDDVTKASSSRSYINSHSEQMINDVKPNLKKVDGRERQRSSSSIDSALIDTDSHAHSIIVQHASPQKSTADGGRSRVKDALTVDTSKGRALSFPDLSSANVSQAVEDVRSVSGSPGRSLLVAPALASSIPTSSASEGTRSTSSSHNRIIMQWSRETSIESLSNADTTSLSSPPSSRSPSEPAQSVHDGVDQHSRRLSDEDAWENLSGRRTLTASPASTGGQTDDAFDDEASTPRRRHPRFAPRQIDGESLVSHRAPRKVSKSLRKVEAEESMSVTSSASRRRSSKNRESVSSEPHAASRRGGKGPIQEDAKNKIDGATSQALRFATSDESPRAAFPKRRLAKSQSDEASPLLSNAKDAQRDTTLPLTSPSSMIKKRGRPTKAMARKALLRRALTADSLIQAPCSSHNVPAWSSSASSLSPAPSSMDLFRSLNGSASTSGSDDLRTGALGGGCNEEREVVRRGTREAKPLWKRKAFLTSGLYSIDHKIDEALRASMQTSDVSARLLQGTSRTRTSNKVSAFPLPTDYGHWLLSESREFRLSYNIMQEIGDIRAKMSSKRKPPPYKHISQNQYVSRPKLPGEIMVCQCPPTGTCDETCVNRQTEYLCHPKHCPCGERCTNIQFGKRKSIKTTVQWYGERGFGLRTLEPIAKGQFIDEYRGEVISYNEMVRRVRDHYKDTGNYYFLMYDAPAGEMLDGGLKGNITRFANHSCDPNCMIQKWLVCGTDEQRAGEFQVALFASRDIAAGEELTYDYGWSAFSPKSVATGDDAVEGSVGGEPCHCGAATCSGVMGVRKNASTVAVKRSVLHKGNSALKKRRRKRKRQGRLMNQSTAQQALVREVLPASSSGLQPPSKMAAADAGPSTVQASIGSTSTLAPPAVLTTFKVPATLSQLIPIEFRASDTITVPLHVIENLRDDLKANVTTPQGRRRWERAVAVMVDAHVRAARSATVERRDNSKVEGQDATTGDMSPPRGSKRTGAPSMTISALLGPALKKRMAGGVTALPLMAQTSGQRRTFPGGRRGKASVARARTISGSERQQRVADQKDDLSVSLTASRLIDSDNVPILEGKRQRRISSRYADLDDILSEQVIGKASRPSVSDLDVEVNDVGERGPKNIKIESDAHDAGDASWLTADTSYDASSLLDTWSSQEKKAGVRDDENSSQEPWSILNYPPGTQFYTRQGEPFDFAVFQRRKRGKKPTPYTLEELHAANERHRINLKRLNDLRKYK